MKVFEKDDKVNFVDKNNVLVGFSNYQRCCEDFGYYFADVVPVGKKLTLDDFDPEKWDFDPHYFEHITKLKGFDEDLKDGGIVTFRLVKGQKSMFLALYNIHNGYYCHGFSMMKDGVTLFQGMV